MDISIACICPPKDGQRRHEQDTITLPDVLDFRRTLTVREEMRAATRTERAGTEGLTIAEVKGFMAEAYLVHCIDRWSCEWEDDGKTRPLPLSKANVREYLLTDFAAAEIVADAADDLYSEKVVLPLLTRASVSSPDTPTSESTSPTNGHGTRRRTPSKRSSTSTSPMAVTGPMAASPGGVSSSSPS